MLVIDVQRTVGIDTEDVGDVDLALGAAAVIQRVRFFGASRTIVFSTADLAVTVEPPRSSPPATVVLKLTEQFDVAALPARRRVRDQFSPWR